MAEPISTTAASASLGIPALLSLVPGVDPAVVWGAFAGAVVFVLASDELTRLKKVVFFCISFGAGCLCASLVTGLIAGVIPRTVEVSRGIGAMVAAAVIVKILQWLIRRADNPDQALKDWRAPK
ncbi:Putative phage holin [Andreprevotia lacus DSM 23236]|jgi:hypothetical protein|uniref:Putative phage holin n=1 Tax=Andreprevotia lacus DSM 23236 TaxID=1121001 RepID=A0A1W1XJM9_9NEIS|nr:phage holin family protein [Andreprevotia lacus]SMC24179.1 Putative phage holin [Andreprevotia lacus DSM 23236]